MYDIPASTLITLSLSLAQHYEDDTRFDHFLSAIRSVIHCDAIALLMLNAPISETATLSESLLLTPKAMQGLSRDTLGRRFLVKEHPRFLALLSQELPYRFAHDCGLPDPYDGLLLDNHSALPIHACMGFPLRKNGQTFALLTVDAMQIDAFNALSERSLSLLAELISQHCHNILLLEQNQQSAKQSQQLVASLSQVETWRDTHEMIGESPAMLKLKRDIELIAASDFSVLIQGETGTGKEVVAQQLHEKSSRKQAPMVYVNCAALPENLIESELFGHAKGAFTGAQSRRAGKFQLADGGTIFLDEIGELPLAAQSKLLRVLQNQEIQPVGQDATLTVDVRVIAATNRDLEAEVENGAFRRDLYHRLNIYPVQVPALRERQGDTTLLCGFFVERLRRKLGVVHLVVSQDVLKALSAYHWPGNVRELEHLLTRAALKAKDRCRSTNINITLSDIDIALSQVAKTSTRADVSDELPTLTSLRASVDEYQKELITKVLTHHEGNWTKAAQHLGVDRGNLNRLAKRLGIFVEKSIKQSK